MSVENNEADKALCCASCGIAEIDDIKLVPCDDCDLVKYCSDECRDNHKPEHEEDCKKRAAELRDEMLFKQPDNSHMGDCPICCVPMPIDPQKCALMSCCSKGICTGCLYVNVQREMEMRLPHTCPFCRESTVITDEEGEKLRMKRIEANNPVPMCQQGGEEYNKGEYRNAFEYFTKAAKLGDAEAHYKLAIMYSDGLGVERDAEKKIYHLEEAAIGGHPGARYSIGFNEMNNGNLERAVKHYIIAARQGDDVSTKMLMKLYKQGFVGKAQLDATLRAHHAAINATKNPQRKAAEKYE